MQKLISATLIAIIVFSFYTIPLQIHAQTMSPSNTNSFSIQTSPLAPTPNDFFSLSITGGSIDISNSKFSIFVNGKFFKKVSGKDSVELLAPDAGKTMFISVVAVSGGHTYKQNISVHPLGLAIVTEPLSSAPPLYMGKSGIPMSGKVRLVAVPDFRTANGTRVDPKTLSYTWRITSSQNMLIDSGIGHSAVIVSMSQLPYRTKTISVLVQNRSDSLVSSRSIDISSTDPSVHIYRDDPLMGILYNKALTGLYSIKTGDVSFTAVSYGLPIDTKVPQITWALSDNQSQTGEKITLRPRGSGTGSEKISVTATSPESYVDTSANFQLLFGDSKKSPWFFGL